ncbi:MAG: hypothetical protein LBC28_04880, partial [Oscillospiraceae bacterium]|nr:hypothetical protein [Oscillospiraceae bacterium]
ATADDVPDGEIGEVYVTVALGGELVLVAQPVTPDVMTYDGAVKAAHDLYYDGGAAAGYEAKVDPASNLYLIFKCWGYSNDIDLAVAPYTIVNDEVIFATVDVMPIKAGDNIIVSFAGSLAITLAAETQGGDVTVTATNWVLSMTTFQYSQKPYAGAEVRDGSGAALGVTDENGQLTIPVPADGIITVGGYAAIRVN